MKFIFSQLFWAPCGFTLKANYHACLRELLGWNLQPRLFFRTRTSIFLFIRVSQKVFSLKCFFLFLLQGCNLSCRYYNCLLVLYFASASVSSLTHITRIFRSHTHIDHIISSRAHNTRIISSHTHIFHIISSRAHITRIISSRTHIFHIIISSRTFSAHGINSRGYISRITAHSYCSYRQLARIYCSRHQLARTHCSHYQLARTHCSQHQCACFVIKWLNPRDGVVWGKSTPYSGLHGEAYKATLRATKSRGENTKTDFDKV